MRYFLLVLMLASCTSPYKDWESYSAASSAAAPASSCSTRLTLGGGLSTRCPSPPPAAATKPTK
ncbi:MAG: hypothetical protein SFW63_02845 [Alphaproteobacteria bacterium]|nr:hypothetical protein [Alphaproteobacteria bacterium]